MSTLAAPPLTSSPRVVLSLAVVAVVLFAPQSRAAQIDVGSGPGCEAATLALALGLALPAGADEIRLSQTVSYTNISQALVNWDAVGAGPLTISGGWANCQSGTQVTRTTVSGMAWIRCFRSRPPPAVAPMSRSSGSRSPAVVVVSRRAVPATWS